MNSMSDVAPRRRALRAMLALGTVLLAGGCSSLVTRESPVKATFLLDPPLPEGVAAAPKSLVLRVGAINVAAPFRGKNFVYRRSELGYQSDYYDEFFVPPSTMLADAIAKGLAAARVFERVVPSGASGNEGDLLLDAFVPEFYGDARGASQAAVLRITFYLTPLQALGSAPVWTHEYTQRVNIDGGTGDALAQGLNRAVGGVLRDLSRDLATADFSAIRRQ